MEKQVEAYIEKVSKNLNLSVNDKAEVIGEIRNHIYEAMNRNENVEDTLRKLGEPNKLAQSYNQSYKLERNEFKFSDIWKNLAFFSSIALSGMFVISILPTVAVVLVLASIFIIGLSLTNLIGITNLPFNVGVSLVTGLPQVLIALVVGAILLLIAWKCWAGFKRYLKYVSKKYHERRVGK